MSARSMVLINSSVTRLIGESLIGETRIIYQELCL